MISLPKTRTDPDSGHLGWGNGSKRQEKRNDYNISLRKGKQMKRIITSVCLTLFMLAVTHVAIAAEFGTTVEAESLVKKAVAEIKANGQEKAFAEFNNPKGKFIDRDLYITVYDMTGKCLAHGANPKMIGKDLIDLKDPDGKPFVKERIEIAKTKGGGWQDYKFTNPVTKKIEPKTMYFEKTGDIIVACGAYKK
jgi:cytochrome c